MEKAITRSKNKNPEATWAHLVHMVTEIEHSKTGKKKAPGLFLSPHLSCFDESVSTTASNSL